MTPEKQADDALALMWLCARSGISLQVDKGALLMRGIDGAPRAELRSLIKPYKAALIGYINALELPVGVRKDIDEAFDAAGWDDGEAVA